MAPSVGEELFLQGQKCWGTLASPILVTVGGFIQICRTVMKDDVKLQDFGFIRRRPEESDRISVRLIRVGITCDEVDEEGAGERSILGSVAHGGSVGGIDRETIAFVVVPSDGGTIRCVCCCRDLDRRVYDFFESSGR